jgi:hypothetical protein
MNKNYDFSVSSSYKETENFNKFENSLTLITLLKWTCISVIFLYILSLHSSYIEKKNKNQIYKFCKEKENLPKIFIALISDGGEEILNNCLFNIFENASCPFRINVTVYKVINEKQFNLKNSASSYKLFAEKKSKSGLTFESQISYLNRNEEDGGPYDALIEAYKYNNANEDFVMTLADFIQLSLHWDKILCNYSSKHLKSKTICILSNHNNINAFSYIAGFCKQTKIPLIDLKKCNLQDHQYSGLGTPCKFWMSECTFAPAQFWKNMQAPIIKNLHFGSDFLLTCLALQNGWNLIHPGIKITTKNNYKISIWYDYKNFTKQYYKNMVDSSFEALEEIKKKCKKALQVLDMENGKISSNALLGVVNYKNIDELIFKYGSVADYFYLFKKFQK